MSVQEQLPQQTQDKEPVVDMDGEGLIAEPVPNISSILEEAIPTNKSEVLRQALWAENIGEMNEELATVMNSLVGLKLLGIQEEDAVTYENPEQILLLSLQGDEVAQETVSRALNLATSHDAGVRSSRISELTKALKEIGWSDEAIKEKTRTPEKLSYSDLSIVHATDHEPIIHRTDGKQHIDDRFTASGQPRPTVHTALNHMVESSSFSAQWDDKRVIVVAPMEGVVELNGDPTSLVGHDTWWEVAPQEGLTLPEGTVVIKPGASRVIQVFAEGREIRYKNDGITAEDTEELFAVAQDYELSLIAEQLGINLDLTYNHMSVGTLGETNLAQYQTVLSSAQRELIKSSLQEQLQKDPDGGKSVFVNLAKRVAVRQALSLQGRELIEPNTVMEASFKSAELDKELNAMAVHRGMTGHHSESTIGRLENMVLHQMQPDRTIDPAQQERLKAYVKERVDDLSVDSLQMFYRLGLL